MAPSLPNAESQWLSQMAAMRQAIAELKLNRSDGDAHGYEDSLVVDDSDLTGDSGSDELWNVFSDEEQEEYSSDMLDCIDDSIHGENIKEQGYGQAWLRSECIAFTNTRAGIDAEELKQQLSAILASDIKSSDIPVVPLI